MGRMEGGGVLIHGGKKNTGACVPGEVDEALGKLETSLITLYTRIDKIKSEISIARHQDQQWYSDLLRRYEKLVREFASIRQAADETIIRMSPDQRKHLLKTAPSFFKFFDWDHRIDEGGNIKYDA